MVIRCIASGLKTANSTPVKNGPIAAPISRQVWFLVSEDIRCSGKSFAAAAGNKVPNAPLQRTSRTQPIKSAPDPTRQKPAAQRTNITANGKPLPKRSEICPDRGARIISLSRLIASIEAPIIMANCGPETSAHIRTMVTVNTPSIPKPVEKISVSIDLGRGILKFFSGLFRKFPSSFISTRKTARKMLITYPSALQI